MTLITCPGGSVRAAGQSPNLWWPDIEVRVTRSNHTTFHTGPGR